MIKLATNLFLIFPPGAGGNHLANMLSMHPKFSNRFTDMSAITSVKTVTGCMPINNHADYMYNMLRFYDYKFKEQAPIQAVDAHFCDLQNLQSENLKKYMPTIINRYGTYILCAHAMEYYHGKQKKDIEAMADSTFCLFTAPTKKNKVLYERTQTGIWANGERTTEKKYDKATFAKLNKINEDDIFQLDTDLFYSITGYEYIEKTIKYNLGLDLPKCCEDMHIMYMDRQTKIYPQTIMGTTVDIK